MIGPLRGWKAEREAKKFWAKPGTEQFDAWYWANVRSAQSKYAQPEDKKLPQLMTDLAKEGKPWLAPSEWPLGHPKSRKAIAA